MTTVSRGEHPPFSLLKSESISCAPKDQSYGKDCYAALKEARASAICFSRDLQECIAMEGIASQ